MSLSIKAVYRPNSFIFVIFASLIVHLSGCSTVARTSLPPQASANITSTKVVLSIPSDEIIVRAEPSNISPAVGYGLIPALIDGAISASRQSALENLSSSFYDKTKQVDFRAIFGQAFNQEFKQQVTLKNMEISMSTRGVSSAMKDANKATLTNDNAFMTIRIAYEFSPNLRQIVVGADTALFNKNAPEPIYKNSFMFVSAPVSEAAPLEAWAANNGELLSQAFTQSGVELGRLLQQDLSAPANEAVFSSVAAKEKVTYTAPAFFPWVFKGNITEKSANRQVIRADTGALLSTPF
jgi:hypothetical protein